MNSVLDCRGWLSCLPELREYCPDSDANLTFPTVLEQLILLEELY